VRHFIGLLFVIFVAVFAYSVASHLAIESRALITGVLIGVFSSIPAALLAALVVRAASRANQPPLQEVATRPAPAPSQPPYIIVNPGPAARPSRYLTYLDGLPEPRQPRSFKVVGDGENDSTEQDPKSGTHFSLLA
jgi:hypothetical protein